VRNLQKCVVILSARNEPKDLHLLFAFFPNHKCPGAPSIRILCGWAGIDNIQYLCHLSKHSPYLRLSTYRRNCRRIANKNSANNGKESRGL
jgi:hypothetical protein